MRSIAIIQGDHETRFVRLENGTKATMFRHIILL